MRNTTHMFQKIEVSVQEKNTVIFLGTSQWSRATRMTDGIAAV